MVINREPRRGRLYFVLLLITAFALLTIDYHSNGSSSPLHPLEKAVAGVVGPGERAVAGLVRPITDEVHFGKQPDKVSELQKQLAAAQLTAEESQNDHRLVEQLDKLMGWPPFYEMHMLPARVVATGDTLSQENSVTIDAGTKDGLHVNMTVVTGNGLIGNVVAVSQTTSTVMLLTDPGLTVQVRNSRTNVRGFVQGIDGSGNLKLTQISQTSDIRVGDFLVTYGSKDNLPYVPDVPVGKVISVNNAPGSATHSAVVQPFASFDNLDLLAIIVPPKTQPYPRLYIPPVTSPAATTPAAPTSTSAAPTTGASVSGTSTPTVTPGAGQTSGAALVTHTAVPPTTPPPVHTTTPPPVHTTTPPPVHTTTPAHTSAPAPHTSAPAPHTSAPVPHTSAPATHTTVPAPHTSAAKSGGVRA